MLLVLRALLYLHSRQQQRRALSHQGAGEQDKHLRSLVREQQQQKQKHQKQRIKNAGKKEYRVQENQKQR